MENGVGYVLYTGKGQTDTSRYLDRNGETQSNGVSPDSRLFASVEPRFNGGDNVHHYSSTDSQSIASLDSKGKQKSFRRVITRFAENTSMQGVPYINNAKLLCAKVVWSIALVVAVGMMGLHLWYLCDQFFQFPKVTKISLGFSKLPFPTITLCNTNPVVKSRLDAYNGAYKLKYLVEDLDPKNLVPDQFREDYDPTEKGNAGEEDGLFNFDKRRKRRKRFTSEKEDLDISKYDPNYVDEDKDRMFATDEFSGEMDKNTKLLQIFQSLMMDIGKENRTYLGHNVSDMLLSCTFGGRKCDSSMFWSTHSPQFGNCWSFNSDQFSVGVSGPSGGLSLKLYLEVPEYLTGVTEGYGARLLIHQPGTFPFPSSEGHYVSASYETNIGLKMISVERETHPYGDCDPDVADRYQRQFGWTYTRKGCQTACHMDAVVNACGCYDDHGEAFAMRKNASLRPCRSNTERLCNKGTQLRIERNRVKCDCPVPCKEVAYEKSFSSRQWPTDEYARILLEGLCEKDPVVCKAVRKSMDSRTLSNNFLKLNIYYEDLNFENIIEEPEIETAQFVSDVGGAVGLWIGLSLLSLCEVVQLVAELCSCAAHKIAKHGARTDRRSARHRDGQYRQKTSQTSQGSIPRENGSYGNDPETHTNAYEDFIGRDKRNGSSNAYDHLEHRSGSQW